MQNLGLNTIHLKIKNIEDMLNVSEEPNLLLKLKKIESDKNKLAIKELSINYQKHLNENINVSVENLVEIIVFSIKYVKQNIINISKITGVKPTVDFENIVICSFIEEIFMDEYSSDFILQSIRTIRNLLDIQLIESHPIAVESKKNSIRIFTKHK